MLKSVDSIFVIFSVKGKKPKPSAATCRTTRHPILNPASPLKYMYHKPRAYNDAIMGAIASQITSHTIVCPTVYSDADQRKHQSSTSLTFVRGIHRGPVNSPHKRPIKRKMFPFDNVIMLHVKKSFWLIWLNSSFFLPSLSFLFPSHSLPFRLSFFLFSLSQYREPMG